MLSLTLTPFMPWHAAHTSATFALPASTSPAAWAKGMASTAKVTANAVFMVFLRGAVRADGEPVRREFIPSALALAPPRGGHLAARGLVGDLARRLRGRL